MTEIIDQRICNNLPHICHSKSTTCWFLNKLKIDDKFNIFDINDNEWYIATLLEIIYKNKQLKHFIFIIKCNGYVKEISIDLIRNKYHKYYYKPLHNWIKTLQFYIEKKSNRIISPSHCIYEGNDIVFNSKINVSRCKHCKISCCIKCVPMTNTSCFECKNLKNIFCIICKCKISNYNKNILQCSQCNSYYCSKLCFGHNINRFPFKTETKCKKCLHLNKVENILNLLKCQIFNDYANIIDINLFYIIIRYSIGITINCFNHNTQYKCLNEINFDTIIEKKDYKNNILRCRIGYDIDKSIAVFCNKCTVSGYNPIISKKECRILNKKRKLKAINQYKIDHYTFIKKQSISLKYLQRGFKRIKEFGNNKNMDVFIHINKDKYAELFSNKCMMSQYKWCIGHVVEISCGRPCSHEINFQVITYSKNDMHVNKRNSVNILIMKKTGTKTKQYKYCSKY